MFVFGVSYNGTGKSYGGEWRPFVQRGVVVGRIANAGERGHLIAAVGALSTVVWP